MTEHREETQYWPVSGYNCTCSVGKKPDYDGHRHTDIVQACAYCGLRWPCDGYNLAVLRRAVDDWFDAYGPNPAANLRQLVREYRDEYRLRTGHWYKSRD
jgi:hypothetical protein